MTYFLASGNDFPTNDIEFFYLYIDIKNLLKNPNIVFFVFIIKMWKEKSSMLVKVLEMQLVLENNKEVKMSKSVSELISKLDNADVKTKNDIENVLVDLGANAVPELVNQLQLVRGSIRGVVAMTLIRIGEPSVAILKEAASANKDFEWVASYLIEEIKCAA